MYSIFEQLLRERGVTVADVCRATGIKQSTMSNWKKRKNRLSPDNAVLVANYFGVTVDYLYGNQGERIIRDIQLQELFEAQLRLNGWKIECDDPAEGKPCDECIARNEVNGEPLWALPDGKEPEKLCDICVLHETTHTLTKGDLRLTFSDDEYRVLIAKAQNETLESIIGFQKEDAEEPTCRIPVLRRVAAGQPLEAVDEIIEWIEISDSMARKGTYFGLRIKGDSMMPEIQDGDTIVCREQPDAENGEIVVVLVNGDDGVCKRLKKYEDGRIALMSDNPAYPPMYFNVSEIEDTPIRIRGVVKELRRTF